MEEKTYTQKELYQFVTEYSKEANDEGFDMSVEDFVSWVEFRGAQKEEPIVQVTDNQHIGAGYNRQRADRLSRQAFREHQEKPGIYADENAFLYTNPPASIQISSEEEQQDKPVLPKKTEPYFGENDSETVAINLGKLHLKVNEIIDYLSRKEQ
jgi:hypothetical protein